MKSKKKPSLQGLIAEKAAKTAVKVAIEEHRRFGAPLAVMRDGKVVLISPEEAALMIKEKPAVYVTHKSRAGKNRCRERSRPFPTKRS